MRPYHLEQIRKFCREYPIERKFLFAPSRQVGYNLLAALARSGCDWLNLESLSPIDHAEMEFGPGIRASGLTPMHTDTAHLIVADLLHTVKSRSGNYFDPVAVTPSLTRSVWETLRSMRLAGVTVDHLGPSRLSEAKADALRYLLEGFERALEERSLFDDARLLQKALHLATPESSPVAIMEEIPLSGLESQYIKRRFAGRVRLIGRNDYGISAPPRSARTVLGGPVPEVGIVGPAGLIKSSGLSRSDRDRVTVCGTRGPETEVSDVIRFALKHEIPLDKIEIAYSRSSVYLPILFGAAAEYDLPITFAEGIPVSLTRPGRALIGILRWIVEDYPAVGLANLIQGGLVGFQRAVSSARRRDNGDLASALLECPIGEGRIRYERGIAVLKSRIEADVEAGWPVAKHRQRIVGLLAEALSTLFEILPGESTALLTDLTDFCIEFLDRFAQIRGEHDKRAQESLSDRIVQMAAGAPEKAGLRFGCQLLIDLIDRHKVQAAIAHPGSLYAVPIARAGYTGREHVFVIGLDVENFPGKVNEDPILLDFEREIVSSNLGIKGRQATDTVWDLLRGLGMVAGNVTLCSSTYNAEREEVVVYPSPLFQQATSDLGYDHENPPDLEVRDVPLSRTEALLPQRRKVDFTSFCGTLYPWLRAGSVAVTERRSGRFTRFDGWIGRGDHRFEIRDDYPVFSARKLEDLAACPYRFFLNDVLYARKPRYYEFDTSRWLSPMDFGRLLHDLYERFLTGLSDRDDLPVGQRHWPELKSILDRLIEEYKVQFPVDNQSAFEFECRRLDLSAAAFLKAEIEDPDSRPLRFEMEFGMQSAELDELREPVVLDLGENRRLALRGRVDRIDETPDGLTIWDYKSGGSWKYRQEGLIRRGLNLQWVLYAHAVNQLAPTVDLPGRVVRSGYYFANDRENGRKISEPVPDPQETGALLEPLFSMVNGGAFFHVHKVENECTFCDFKSVCASEKKLVDEIEWIENLDNPVMTDLDEWLRSEEADND